MHPKERKAGVYKPIGIAFTIAKPKRQIKSPWADKWRKKGVMSMKWNIIKSKGNESLTSTTVGMDFQNIH